MENTPQKNEVSQKNAMSALAYLGPLVIVPYLTLKDDPFVEFHIKQGLVLLVIEVAIWFLGMIFWPLWLLLNFANIAVFILVIIGIINALHGKEKALPLVGNYSKYFNI